MRKEKEKFSPKAALKKGFFNGNGFNYRGNKQTLEQTYSEQLLIIHMRNDRQLYEFIQRNKSKLLKMDKYTLVNTLKRNMSPYVKGDRKNILARFIRKSVIVEELRIK